MPVIPIPPQAPNGCIIAASQGYETKACREGRRGDQTHVPPPSTTVPPSLTRESPTFAAKALRPSRGGKCRRPLFTRSRAARTCPPTRSSPAARRLGGVGVIGACSSHDRFCSIVSACVRGPNRSRATFRRADRFGHGLCGSVRHGCDVVVVVTFVADTAGPVACDGAGRPRRCFARGEGPRGRLQAGSWTWGPQLIAERRPRVYCPNASVKATRGDGCAMAFCKNRGMSQTSLLPRKMLYSEGGGRPRG